MRPDLSKSIVWLHADCLSPYNPAMVKNPNVPAIFVWDDELLEEWQITLKRIVFIYECLLDLPVTIRRGNVEEKVVLFAQECGAGRIITNESPSPRFREICQRISHSMPSGSRLEVLRGEPLVSVDKEIDLKRFSRYWRTVKSYAMISSQAK
jgi:hypothetical protein